MASRDKSSSKEDEESSCRYLYVDSEPVEKKFRSNGVEPRPLSHSAEEVEKELAIYKKEVSEKSIYYTAGKVKDFPILSLTATRKNQTDIRFQFPYNNVEEVYAQADQSQVGTSTKTLFLPDARKSKEFSKLKVNESWEDTVTSVCSQVRQVLAPGATKVTADLYKLLLYREKDFFHHHQDSQRSARMFATLLFFLPVEYEGGEFVVHDPEKYENTFIIEKAKEESPWVAFYTDVRHEVREIKKGYRVALNYSLCFEGAMPPPVFPPLSSSATAAVESYFSVYKNNKLSFPLRYEYTLATLSPEYLKGIDAYVYSALREVCTLELQFVLQFKKTRAIYYEYGESENMKLFQNVYAVDEEKARLFFEMSAEKKKALEELDHEEEKAVSYKNIKEVSQEYDKKYHQLMEMVKFSQRGTQTEWIVKRNSFGQPDVSVNWIVSFQRGDMGAWLGNSCPAEDYYYLCGAIVARKEKNNR